jgi:tRNA A37 threonylcarbamoyladenosine dehydratase
VIRGATFGQGYLNRQIITLLFCLGVPESYFLAMQRKAKENASIHAINEKIGKKKVKRLTKKEENIIVQSLDDRTSEGLENLRTVLTSSRILAGCV